MIDKGIYTQKKQLVDDLWEKYQKASEELKDYAMANTPLPKNIYWKDKKMEYYYKLTAIKYIYDNLIDYDTNFLSLTENEYRLNKVWSVSEQYIKEQCLPITAEQWNKALIECSDKIMENTILIPE